MEQLLKGQTTLEQLLEGKSTLEKLQKIQELSLGLIKSYQKNGTYSDEEIELSDKLDEVRFEVLAEVEEEYGEEIFEPDEEILDDMIYNDEEFQELLQDDLFNEIFRAIFNI